MKIPKQHYRIDNEEDKSASSYPLYPCAENISNKEKHKKEPGLHWDSETIYPISKISEWHESEYNPD